MATTIKLKNGSGAPLAGDLVQGEPAFDLTNKRLYTEDSGGTVIEVGTNPSTIDINAGTIDGTVIGGASAAAGTFTTFTSTGIDDNATSTAITIDASENVGIGASSPNKRLEISNGSNISYTVDVTAGNYVGLSAYDYLNSTYEVLGTNGSILTFNTGSGASVTEAMRIDSSGNVGIGVTAGFLGSNTLAIERDKAIRWQDSSNGTQYADIYGSLSSDLIFRTGSGSTERMRIDSSGNVGIGTSSPDALLNLEATQNPVLRLGSSDGTVQVGDILGTVEFYSNDTNAPGVGAKIYAEQEDQNGAAEAAIVFETGVTGALAERMRINSDGNVGIGTDSPAELLHLKTEGTQLLVEDTSSGNKGSFFVANTTTVISSDPDNAVASSVLQFQVDGSEAMRIDSSGNVGIGTTSPSEPLSVTGNVTIDSAIYRTDTGAGGIRFATAGNIRPVNNAGTSTDLALDIGDPSFRFNDLYLGGDASVDGAITCSGLTATLTSGYIRIQDLNSAVVSTTDMGGIEWRTGDSNVSGANRITASISAIGDGTFNAADKAPTALTFATHGTSGVSPVERMRIDSSGNLLVGKNVANDSTVGARFSNAGFMSLVRDGGRPLFIRRDTSDGDMVEFSRSGTTVGTIGSLSGTRLRVSSQNVAGYLGIGATDYFVWNTTDFRGQVDGGYDLGASVARFKDLYLSGGVYLGGTGSANHLDDYEEGTWTPSLSVGTATFTTPRYTKIGRIVHLEVLVAAFSDRSTNSAIVINGLPFTTSSTSKGVGNTLSRYINSGGDQVVAWLGNSRNYITFYTVNQGSDYVNVAHQHLNSSSSLFHVSVTYEAT